MKHVTKQVILTPFTHCTYLQPQHPFIPLMIMNYDNDNVDNDDNDNDNVDNDNDNIDDADYGDDLSP